MNCASSDMRAAAVVEALRGFEIGDAVDITAHDYFCEIVGTVVAFGDYTGSVQVLTPDGPLWFAPSELRLV